MIDLQSSLKTDWTEKQENELNYASANITDIDGDINTINNEISVLNSDLEAEEVDVVSKSDLRDQAEAEWIAAGEPTSGVIYESYEYAVAEYNTAANNVAIIKSHISTREANLTDKRIS